MSRNDRFEVEASKISQDFLEDIGLGRDAPLLHEPKLFLEGPFLSALLFEFDRDLRPEVADQALFAIGASHGARAAEGILQQVLANTPSTSAQPLALPMVLNPIISDGAAIGFEGEWPETHEARARLAQFESASEPRCLLSAGYTSAWLSRLHNRDLMAIEVECVASGGSCCRFRALEREVHLGLPQDHNRPLRIASTPEPIDLAHSGHESIEAPPIALDPSDEAVHVWGPVMVLPFRRAEEAKMTIQVLSEEGNALGVRAVVVNLEHGPLSEEHEFEFLVETLEIIEQWGAEAILCGLSEPISRLVEQRLVAPLLQRDSLPEAVASAFQVAEAQRYPL